MMDYSQFKNRPKEEKLQQIRNSRQQQKYRKPLPIQGLSFPEQSWTNNTITQSQSFLWSTTVTQTKLHNYRWKAKGLIKGVVIMFHGLTSHINQGSYVAKVFAQNGYEVVGQDQRGFGKSQGTRGLIKDFQVIILDSLKFVQIVEKTYPNVPLFISGLSFGGLISFTLGLRHPQRFAGAILMAPAFRPYQGTMAYYGASILSFFFPNTQVPKIGNKEGNKRGSKNPNVSELRKADKYRYQQNPYISTLKTVLQGMRESEQHYEKFTLPVLIVQGAKDNSVDPDGAIQFYQKCSSKNKEILFYPNLWHNIWQQEQIYQIMEKIIHWLDRSFQPKL